MVNLKGLDILGAVKAGAQERTKPAFARSSNKESSFKEVLGQSEQKQESKSFGKLEKEKAEKDSSQKGSTEKETVAKDAPAKDAAAKEAPAKEAYKKDAIGKEASTKLQSTSIESRSIKAQDVGAQSIPDAPSPIAPPIARGGPEFIGAMPSGLPVKNDQSGIAQFSSDDGIDSLTRRAVWNDFLRKMNDELGITADKVLEAFSSLTEKELSAPPEQNVEKLVMALGLNPQQSEVAQKLFTDLLKKTQSKSIGDELASSATQINLSLMSQRELQRKQIQNSLDKMNSQFFMSRQGAQIAQPKAQSDNANAAFVPAPELGQAPLEASQVPADLSTASTKALPEAAVPTKSSTPAFDKLMQRMQPVSAQEQKQFADSGAAQMSAQVAAASDANSAVASSSVAPSSSVAVNNVAVGAGAAEATISAAPSAKTASSSASAIASAVTNAFSNVQNRMGAESEESGDELNDEEVLQDMPLDRSNLGAKVDGGFSLNPTQPPLAGNEISKPMAVPELIQNARIMVRDGGGEMKVTLTPEGLGEVAMKVSVDNGRVNVQMITESDEAKKMIEKGLVDLKSSLHANNLNLDSIKVDTASNMGHQLEQQYRDAQKQQAQQFLENFRQDQQGWRRNFFEPPTAQLARSQVQGSSGNGTPYYNANSKRAGSNRRLDLVA